MWFFWGFLGGFFYCQPCLKDRELRRVRRHVQPHVIVRLRLEVSVVEDLAKVCGEGAQREELCHDVDSAVGFAVAAHNEVVPALHWLPAQQLLGGDNAGAHSLQKETVQGTTYCCIFAT
jgi:hypothetical protein